MHIKKCNLIWESVNENGQISHSERGNIVGKMVRIVPCCV